MYIHTCTCIYIYMYTQYLLCGTLVVGTGILVPITKGSQISFANA